MSQINKLLPDDPGILEQSNDSSLSETVNTSGPHEDNNKNGIDTMEVADILQSSIDSTFKPTGDGINVPFESPLVKVSAILKNQGISETRLPEALAVLIGIHSAYMGDPIPILITEDEGSSATHFLDICLSVSYEESWIVLTNKNKPDLKQGNPFKGKTLISYDAEIDRNELTQILWTAERGTYLPEWQQKNKEDYRPSSFVAIVRNRNNSLLQNRYVTRIHLTADKASKAQLIQNITRKTGSTSYYKNYIETGCIKTFFKRLRPLRVHIEYADKIFNAHAVNQQNAVPVLDLAMRAIRNITRINNSPYFNNMECLAAFIGIALYDLVDSDQPNERSFLNSTKIDYYYFKIIIGGFLKSVNDFMTQRQRRIFDAIFNYNIKRMKHFNKKISEVDVTNKIVDPLNRAWLATRNIIWESIKEDGGEPFSRETLYNEIVKLEKRNIIFHAKRSKKTNEFGYGVMQLGDISMISTTDAKDIDDPLFKDTAAKVKNPITGAIESI